MTLQLTQAVVHGLPFAVADLDYSYAPRFLLSAPFKRSIVEHTDFAPACEEGFTCYFQGLMREDEQGREVFIKQGYTWNEVVALVVEWVEGFANLPRMLLRLRGMSLAWIAGFGLGWLSALAVFRPDDARRALVVLTVLLGSGVRPVAIKG